MTRSERALAAVIGFAFTFACMMIVGAMAHADGNKEGYKRGYTDAERHLAAYYNDVYRRKETELGAMVDAANARADAAERELEAAQAELNDKSMEDAQCAPLQKEGTRAVEDAGPCEIKEKPEKNSMSEWWSEDDVFCLAAVIYQEAGGDACTDETRRMVADVVMNRVSDNRFPNTIREVLEDAPGGALQYGRFAITGVQFPASAENDCEKDAVLRAWRIADSVLEGEHSELYGAGYIWQAEFRQGTDCIWRDGICFGRG